MPCTPAARQTTAHPGLDAAERYIEPLGDLAVRAAINVGERDAVALQGVGCSRHSSRRPMSASTSKTSAIGAALATASASSASIVSSSAETSRPIGAYGRQRLIAHDCVDPARPSPRVASKLAARVQMFPEGVRAAHPRRARGRARCAALRPADGGFRVDRCDAGPRDGLLHIRRARCRSQRQKRRRARRAQSGKAG